MAHELDYSRGTAAMIYARTGGTPWHSLGTPVADGLTVAEALSASGTDYAVELRPLYCTVQREVPDGNFEQTVAVPDNFATVRTDTGGVLGVVGSRYNVLQNADAFGVLSPLVDAELASVETMGALRGGRDVWALVRFNVDDPVVREVFADEVVPYGLVSNNHSGMRQVIVQETPIRVVCANTLGMAHAGGGRAVKIRHTSAVGSRTVDAAGELFRGIVERYRAVAGQYSALKRTHLDREQFERLVLNVVAPLPKDTKSPRYESALNRARRRRDEVSRLWDAGKGHTGNRTAWEAYNAVTESVDHDDALWPLRGESTRTEQLMSGGSLAKVKDAALASLLTAV